MLQIRKGKRDNLGIIFHIAPLKRMCDTSLEPYCQDGSNEGSPHTCMPGRVAQSVGHLTRKSGVLGSIPGLAIYFGFSFPFFKKGSCQLLAKVCARSTG